MCGLSEVSTLDTFLGISIAVESVMDELTEKNLLLAFCLGIFGEVAGTRWLRQFGSEVWGAFLLLARLLEHGL